MPPILHMPTPRADMRHAPTSMIMAKHPLWDILVRNKHRLYTKGFPSAMSFVRSALNRGAFPDWLSHIEEIGGFFG